MANSFSSDDFFWQTGAKQHLSRMLLDLPQSSQVKMEFGATFLEVRVVISPLTAEKPPPTRRMRHLPPSKIKRNRRRLLKFLEKGMQPDETQTSGYTPAAVAAPDDPQEGGQAPAVTEVEEHPPLESGIPSPVNENFSSPASENGPTPVQDRPSSLREKIEELNKQIIEFSSDVRAATSRLPHATPYIVPHLRSPTPCTRKPMQKNPVNVASQVSLTHNRFAALACESEHGNTDTTDEENADEDDDPTREEVAIPAMDGKMLLPVADAVLTPSPAGKPHRKEIAPRKIVKVRRKGKNCEQNSCKSS